MRSKAYISAQPRPEDLQGRDLSILLVESDPDDTQRVLECLSEGLSGGFLVDRTETLMDAVAHIGRFDYDVALVELALQDSSGIPTLDSVLRAAPDLPVIILTSMNDEDVALACIEAGAHDYVIKECCGVEVLVRSLRFAIQRKRSVAQGTALDITGQRQFEQEAPPLGIRDHLVSRRRFEVADPLDQPS